MYILLLLSSFHSFIYLFSFSFSIHHSLSPISHDVLECCLPLFLLSIYLQHSWLFVVLLLFNRFSFIFLCAFSTFAFNFILFFFAFSCWLFVCMVFLLHRIAHETIKLTRRICRNQVKNIYKKKEKRTECSRKYSLASIHQANEREREIARAKKFEDKEKKLVTHF